MANVQGFGDLQAFSIGGNSLLTVIKNVQYKWTLDKADTSTISRTGRRRQTVNKGGTITTGAMSTLASDSGMVASSLSISAFTLDGVSYLAYLRGGSVRGSFETRMVQGAADAPKWPQNFGKDYEWSIDLLIPAAADVQTANAAINLGPRLHDTDVLDQDLTRVVLSITIDGVATTMECEIDEFDHIINEKQEQEIKLRLTGNDPGTGNYPTAPTGSTSLLEKAFNASDTALAFVLTTSTAADGETYSGNAIITDFGFSFNGGEIIIIDYTFSTRGAVTAATAT